MFACKKEILNRKLSSNTFVPYKNQEQSTKFYSPIQIKSLPPISKNKTSAFRSFSTLKHRTSISSLPSMQKTLNLVEKKRSNKQKKPTIIQTILDFKSKVANKYTKYYLLISHSVAKPIEFEDIMNFLKSKQLAKDIRPVLGQPESLNSIVSHLSKTIMKTFDINGKLSINLDEFLGACSVHKVFFPNTGFNLLNINWLGRLKEKIEELKKNFSTYAAECSNKTEYLLGIVNEFVNFKDRMGFVGFIKSSNINFALYLQILPVFLNLENSYL